MILNALILLLGAYGSEALSTIQSNQDDVHDCYRPVASRYGGGGVLGLSWTIGRQGEVTMVGVVRNTFPDDAFARCVRDRSRAWRFPPPEAGTAVVRYEWNLRVR